MSGGREEQRACCDPEAVFELADGAVGPGRGRELFSHLESCPGCREHYEKEKSLSENLSAIDGAGFAETPSVCREVAMALPTRSVKTRFMWAALAVGIILSAVFALVLDGKSPFIAASGMVDALWSVASGFADMAAMIVGLAGPVIVAALVVGAVFDVLVAGVVFSAMRRRGAGETRRV